MTALELIEKEKIEKTGKLDLSFRELNKIPDEIDDLTWLHTLDLRSNQISDIRFLEKQTGLQTLYLSYNKISDINFLEKLRGLQTLYLSYNQISDYSFLEKLTGLQNLHLRSNQISDISLLEKLTGLQTLDLSSNQISDINFLEKLTGLQNLYLSYNQISDYSFLEKLRGLQTLDLSFNKISDYSFLEKLTGLQNLYLLSNQISDIRFLEKLTGLQTLNLSDNQISDISFLEKLTDLQALYLSYNKISDITPLKNLITDKRRDISWKEYSSGISIKDNPLTAPPKSIVEQGRVAVIDWFEANEKGSKPFNEVKIILIGHGKSGKTSLVNRIVYNTYNEDEETTHGINLESINLDIEDKKIKTNFWDFGGQVMQHTVHKFFLTDSCIYILVSDNRKDDDPKYFLEHIRTLGGNAPTFVVYNKSDENNPELYARKTLMDDYSNIRGFFPVSCKNDTGIQDGLLPTLKAEINKMDSATKPYPAEWLEVKEQLEEETSFGKNYITYKRYEEICKKKGIPEKSKKTLIKDLSTLGTIVYFDNSLLDVFHVLNPEWLSSGVYRIITHKITEQKKGIISVADFAEIFKKDEKFKLEFQPEHYSFLLALMKQFKLCYSENDIDILVPPQFGKDIKANYSDFRTVDSRMYFFEFDHFMPSSIIHSFITSHILDADEKDYWYRGIVLKDPASNTTALVEMKDKEKRINLYIKGEDIRGYWSYLSRELLKLTGFYSGLNPKLHVALDNEKRGTKSISFQILMNALSCGETELFINDLKRKENILGLLCMFAPKNEINEELEKQKDKHHGDVNVKVDVHNVFKPKIDIAININIVKPILDSLEGDLNYLKDELRDNTPKEIIQTLNDIETIRQTKNVGDVKRKGVIKRLEKFMGKLKNPVDWFNTMSEAGKNINEIKTVITENSSEIIQNITDLLSNLV
jgi:internalin A